MTLTILPAIHAITQQVTRTLRGEAITLHDRDGDISTEISDAVVSVSPPIGVGIDAGKAEYSGALRLAATHRAAALTCNTVTVRGDVWHVLSVGRVHGDSFRVEIGRTDEQHSNKFDFNDQQAVWHEE